VALGVDVCMFIFEILLNACIKGCGRLAWQEFEDKEWFVGRAHKGLRGIKESIYTFRIWMYI